MEKIEKNNEELEKSGGAVGNNTEQKEKNAGIEGLDGSKNTDLQSQFLNPNLPSWGSEGSKNADLQS